MLVKTGLSPGAHENGRFRPLLVVLQGCPVLQPTCCSPPYCVTVHGVYVCVCV